MFPNLGGNLLEKIVRVAPMHSGQGVIFSFNKHTRSTDALETILSLLKGFYSEIFSSADYPSPRSIVIKPDEKPKSLGRLYPQEISYVFIGRYVEGFPRKTGKLLGYFNFWKIKNRKYLMYGAHFTMRDRSLLIGKFIYDKILTLTEATKFCEYVWDKIPHVVPLPTVATAKLKYS